MELRNINPLHQALVIPSLGVDVEFGDTFTVKDTDGELLLEQPTNFELVTKPVKSGPPIKPTGKE